MIYFTLYLVALAAMSWLLAGAVLKSWQMPYRTSGVMLPAGPVAGDGPAVGRVAVEYRPAPPAPVVVDPVHVGATEDWSPRHAAAEAAERMLPLDDVDEWLAARLSAYGHALARIEADAGRAADEELARFQQGSMAMHEYRSMILDSTGGYGPREHMQLEAMLA